HSAGYLALWRFFSKLVTSGNQRSNNPKPIMKKVFTHVALLILLCCATKSYSTHLMGGNLSYTFVSFNPGNNTYTYTVELRIYRYCASGSSGLDDTMYMGAYYEGASLSKTLA